MKLIHFRFFIIKKMLNLFCNFFTYPLNNFEIAFIWYANFFLKIIMIIIPIMTIMRIKISNLTKLISNLILIQMNDFEY